MGGTLYFSADDGITGGQLWKSDGTAAGTKRVTDISHFDLTDWMTSIGRTLFFVANDGSSGYELWKSDGTAAGTERVKDINPGRGGSLSSLDGSPFPSDERGRHALLQRDRRGGPSQAPSNDAGRRLTLEIGAGHRDRRRVRAAVPDGPDRVYGEGDELVVGAVGVKVVGSHVSAEAPSSPARRTRLSAGSVAACQDRLPVILVVGGPTG